MKIILKRNFYRTLDAIITLENNIRKEFLQDVGRNNYIRK